jgi:hypothetical protein
MALLYSGSILFERSLRIDGSHAIEPVHVGYAVRLIVVLAAMPKSTVLVPSVPFEKGIVSVYG